MPAADNDAADARTGSFREMLRIVLPFCALAMGACVAQSLQPAPASLYGDLAETDLLLAVEAMQQALEGRANGETLGWSNAETGNRGAFTPIQTFITTGGYPCRRYAEQLTVDGQSATYENTACRNDGGTWVWVG